MHLKFVLLQSIPNVDFCKVNCWHTCEVHYIYQLHLKLRKLSVLHDLYASEISTACSHLGCHLCHKAPAANTSVEITASKHAKDSPSQRRLSLPPASQILQFRRTIGVHVGTVNLRGTFKATTVFSSGWPDNIWPCKFTKIMIFQVTVDLPASSKQI